MDAPLFDPWSSEHYLDGSGEIQTRELYITHIKLKKGTVGSFIQTFPSRTADGPFFLEFYSPAGLKMTAEIRGLAPQAEQEEADCDTLSLLVHLTPDQVLALFPCDETTGFGY